MKTEKVIKWIFILFGIILIANSACAAILSNMHIGIFVTFVLGVGFIASGVFTGRKTAKILIIIKYIFLFGAFSVFSCVIALFWYGNTDYVTNNEDAVIVLGAGICGEKPGENLRNRLDCAVEYFYSNPDAVIVVSGGQGHQESITEALAMERYLTQKGIPKNKILKEEKAESTIENFSYSKEILDEYLQMITKSLL